MKRFVELTLVVVLLAAAPVYAQTTEQSVQPGTSESANQQQTMSVIGKITEVDLARGTLTLDNGMQFRLAPSFQFTSAPALGQEVEVLYDTQGGQNVAHSVDAGFEGQGSD